MVWYIVMLGRGSKRTFARTQRGWMKSFATRREAENFAKRWKGKGYNPRVKTVNK